MKLKYFLRGLGIGIVFTTIVLTFINPKTEKAALTDAEIMERAKMLGMVRRDEWNIMPSVSPAESALPKSSEPVESASPKPSEPVKSASPKPSESVKSASPKPSEPIKNSAINKTKQKEDYIIIKVERNMGSEQVAKILEEKGVIESYTEFNQFLAENGYQTRIRDGEHKVLKDADYSEIAQALTK